MIICQVLPDGAGDVHSRLGFGRSSENLPFGFLGLEANAERATCSGPSALVRARGELTATGNSCTTEYTSEDFVAKPCTSSCCSDSGGLVAAVHRSSPRVVRSGCDSESDHHQGVDLGRGVPAWRLAGGRLYSKLPLKCDFFLLLSVLSLTCAFHRVA